MTGRNPYRWTVPNPWERPRLFPNKSDVQVVNEWKANQQGGAQHFCMGSPLQIDPVDAEDGHRSDCVRNHVENNARLAESGGVATRALVQVANSVWVVFQVFDSGVKRRAQGVGQLA